MNKIILQVGLLIFCLAIIFFSRIGLSAQEVLLRSFVIFIVLAIMLSIIMLIVLKSINQISLEKSREISEKQEIK